MSRNDPNLERQLLLQATIVSTMMLAVARGFHGDYRRKHVGAVWEELMVSFVLWAEDTTQNPLTILGIAKILGIPTTNVSRAVAILVGQGLVCKIKRGYGRDVSFISARPNSRFFIEIRQAVMTAGAELQEVFRANAPR